MEAPSSKHHHLPSSVRDLRRSRTSVSHTSSILPDYLSLLHLTSTSRYTKQYQRVPSETYNGPPTFDPLLHPSMASLDPDITSLGIDGEVELECWQIDLFIRTYTSDNNFTGGTGRKVFWFTRTVKNMIKIRVIN